MVLKGWVCLLRFCSLGSGLVILLPSDDALGLYCQCPPLPSPHTHLSHWNDVIPLEGLFVFYQGDQTRESGANVSTPPPPRPEAGDVRGPANTGRGGTGTCGKGEQGNGERVTGAVGAGEEGRMGDGEEGVGERGERDLFSKKHLEKQSGGNKQASAHCPPNK